MNDLFERTHGLAPDNPSDALADEDSDGLSNLLESILGSNPLQTDSDGDGFSDSLETNQFTDPNSADSIPPLYRQENIGRSDLNNN